MPEVEGGRDRLGAREREGVQRAHQVTCGAESGDSDGGLRIHCGTHEPRGAQKDGAKPVRGQVNSQVVAIHQIEVVNQNAGGLGDPVRPGRHRQLGALATEVVVEGDEWPAWVVSKTRSEKSVEADHGATVAGWEDARMSAVDRLWGVVPAGGAGTRLWPLSRAGEPKFLHDLTGTGRTLLQATVDRLTPLVGDRLIVVTGAAHAAAVRRQLPEAQTVLAEPSARDSMAAIAWAAAVVEQRQPDGLIGSFAADHVIPDADALRACVREAAAAADQGWLVTIGIEPTAPSSAFGYIKASARIEGFSTARVVEEFVEKPDAQRAAQYLASGEYRWNAGMFVCRASVLLDLLAMNHPELAAGARQIAADSSVLDAVWPELTKIAIDHAVAEPAALLGKVAMVPGEFTWDDVGDFDSLAHMLPEVDGVRVLGDGSGVIVRDGSGLVVRGTDRMVAVVGLDDVVVVETEDAVLVTTRAHAQQVKAIVDVLRERGRTDLI